MLFSNLIKMTFSYTERALTPKSFSNMVQSSLRPSSFVDIMHNLYLYQNNINVFDYDYFQKVSYVLLDYGKKMTVGEIMTVLRLGQRHNVKNEMIWKHFEAEVHRRLHKAMTPLFENQEKQVEKKFKNLYEKLESKSSDHFQLLTSEFIQNTLKQQNSSESKTENIQQDKNSTISSQNTTSITTRSKKEEIAKYAYDLVEILIWYGSENWRLVNLLLEAQLYPSIVQKTPYASIRFAQLLVYACQLNMKNYEENKSKYTARSVKKIFNFQSYYFVQLQKNLKQVLSQFSEEDLKYITDVIRSFPVKKRQHRRNITELISNQWIARGLEIREEEQLKLQQILRKDEKLIKKFRQSIQKIEQTDIRKKGDQKHLQYE